MTFWRCVFHLLHCIIFINDIPLIQPLHAVQTLMGAEKTPMAPLYFPFYFGLISALERQLSNTCYSYLRQFFEVAINKLKEHIDDM